MSYDFNEDIEAQVKRLREELRCAQERHAAIRIAANWFVAGVLTPLLFAYTFKQIFCGIANFTQPIKPSTIGIGTGAGAVSHSPHDGLADAQRRKQLAEGLTVEEAQRKDVKPWTRR